MQHIVDFGRHLLGQKETASLRPQNMHNQHFRSLEYQIGTIIHMGYKGNYKKGFLMIAVATNWATTGNISGNMCDLYSTPKSTVCRALLTLC